MSETMLDRATTAVLTLDFQKGILDLVPGAESIVGRAIQTTTAARGAGLAVFHVGLGFRAGHPEIPSSGGFARVKQGGLFLQGSESSEFAPSLVQKGDVVVYKQRVSGFSENELHMLLRAGGYKTLVLYGISSSGIVLSTLRRAYDLDYQCLVVKDCCFDPDEEVHRVLCNKVFAAQARVVAASEFEGLLPNQSRS